MGDLRAAENPLVRLHSECLTGDVLASDRCDCGRQLQRSLEMISTEACGVLVYLRGHEGRGIGLSHKIRAYWLQDIEGLDTVDANTAQGLPVDSRDYGVGAAILADLGLSTIRLMTNNPKKVTDLRESGFDIVERIQLEVDQTPANSRYLETKRDRMGHSLP
jgi:3,4-dihydroxy 2-butanone 4-phosphate synthase/GTP cyclohydrolase II